MNTAPTSAAEQPRTAPRGPAQGLPNHSPGERLCFLPREPCSGVPLASSMSGPWAIPDCHCCAASRCTSGPPCHRRSPVAGWGECSGREHSFLRHFPRQVAGGPTASRPRGLLPDRLPGATSSAHWGEATAGHCICCVCHPGWCDVCSQFPSLVSWSLPCTLEISRRNIWGTLAIMESCLMCLNIPLEALIV